MKAFDTQGPGEKLEGHQGAELQVQSVVDPQGERPHSRNKDHTGQGTGASSGSQIFPWSTVPETEFGRQLGKTAETDRGEDTHSLVPG